MKRNSTQDYYRQQSSITTLAEYESLFGALPDEIEQLVEVVQGLIVHAGWAESYGLDLTAERSAELHLRTMPQMVARILELNPAPLTTTRPTTQRLVGICRDFALFLVAMLRHQGIPARLRVGFGGYFNTKKPRFWDHRITEYWNAQQGRWILVDPQIDEVQRAAKQIHFDTLDVSVDSPFHFAGYAWQLCRRGAADPEQYGDSETDLGMPMIRYALLHDFDALNQVELVGFDAWCDLIDKPEEEVTEEEWQFLDEVAELTLNVDDRFTELQNFYNTSAYGRTILGRLQALAV